MAKPKFKMTTDGNKATFIITGILSDDENNGADFLQAFREAEKEYKEIVIHIINLYGGHVDQGNVIARVIRQSKSKTTTITEGLSASMGVPISLSGNHKRYMIKRSRLMLHRATVDGYGNSDELRETAKMLDGVEKELAEDIAKILGKTAEFVKKEYFNQGDKYLTAEEAKAAGFIHEVIEGELKDDLPKNLLKNPKREDIALFYANQIHKSNPKTEEMEKLPLMVASLQLANPEFKGETPEAVASEMKAQAEALVKARKDNKELSDKVKAAEDDKAVALVESYKEKLNLGEKQIEHYTKFAKTDYDGAKAVLESTAPHVPASARMTPEGSEEKEQYKGWDFAKFQKEAPKELARMKSEEPDRFKELFKAKFGNEPNM